MATIYDSALYQEDLQKVAALSFPWERLQDSSVLISGASGMIGSFLIDVLMKKNSDGLGCKIYALGRSKEKLEKRFSFWKNDTQLSFVPYDINQPLEAELDPIDYILHLASNTHPVQYATDPIGTITTNIIGLQNMLSFAVDTKAKRVAFASSNEIYGENRGDVELFSEDYLGYIDCNTLRAGYPESKRCGEALCQAYIKGADLDIVIPRLTRSYGPTMLMTDTKAISQFIKKGIAGEDIVLKSAGNQLYSYTYVADAVSGLLTILLLGEKGQAYNIADEASDVTLKDLAEMIAASSGKKVVFEIPDETERAGYSKATKARLDGSRLRGLGWEPFYEIREGMERTLRILKGIEA